MPKDPPDLQQLILDSIGDGVFTVDEQWRVTSFNSAAERLTGRSRAEAIGMKCHDVFRADICQTSCALRHTLQTGEPLHDVPITILDRDMEAVPVRVSTAALEDAQGRVLGGVEIMRDVSEIETLRRALEERHVFQDIVGDSPAMQELFRLLPDVAAADVPVLVLGPSGTGKELVARAVHRLSGRADGPFVSVNCGALPDTLLESELFGHRRGAFTDAKHDHPGRFVLAHGGTLFLDEIGDTSPAFQVKLLRALQEGEVQPLGATRPVPVDVRVVSATNRDLAAMVREGTFREDLYYRLRVVALELPALRERRADIPLLAEHLLGRLAVRRGKPACRLSRAALDALLAYDFPGNVRELENLLERALVLCHGPTIRAADLPPEVREPGRRQAVGTAAAEGPEPVRAPVAPAAAEPGDLRRALEEHRWERAKAAQALGISRATLWRRMKAAGLIEPRG
jgi:PAS domain S-box-containing protein